jgi:hypothetical protein
MVVHARVGPILSLVFRRTGHGEAMTDGDLRAEIDWLLEQAAAFVRGGDYTGAYERVRYAQGRLSRDSVLPDDPILDELYARVELTRSKYEQLLEEWQRQNAARYDAYLRREREAIGAGTPGSPEKAKRRTGR